MTAETEDEIDFVDTSIVPPTLLLSVWTQPGSESRAPHAPRAGVADGDASRTLAIPPALVTEALA
ncbi:MAG TPA: hypothetical protein VF821_26805 [Lentzea sp.]